MVYFRCVKSEAFIGTRLKAPSMDTREPNVVVRTIKPGTPSPSIGRAQSVVSFRNAGRIVNISDARIDIPAPITNAADEP